MAVLKVPEERDYAAITTANQWKAIGLFCNRFRNDKDFWSDFRKLQGKEITRKAKPNFKKVKAHLVNSWNTEKLIGISKETYDESLGGAVLHWIFPQAYYSTFSSALGAFEARGWSESSHTAVLKKYSSLAKESSLPSILNVFAEGPPSNIKVFGLKHQSGKYQSTRFNSQDQASIDTHIWHFLKSTRSIACNEKKESFKFRTKNGCKRKNLTKENWKTVSDKIGSTSWMDLLYRKRIMANYKDIETFFSDQIKVIEIIEGLEALVAVLNAVNEIFVASIVGIERVADDMLEKFPKPVSRLNLYQ